MLYQGFCHCGSIAFEFQSSEIKEALQCNCSICIRKNAIMSKEIIEGSNFKLIKGDNMLSTYHWGDKDVNHYFCKRCGIYPFHNTTHEPEKYRVNLGCVNEIEPRDLNIKYFDGQHLL